MNGSWESAWESALYGPDGCYRRQRPGAHFATAAQGVPGTAPVLAEALGTLADRCGRRRIVDLAAGGGELAAALAEARPDLAVTAVDIGPRPAALPDAVAWARTAGGADLTGLPDPTGALVVAVEWLDVIPCPVWQIDGGVPRVVHVADDGTETLGPAAEGADLGWARRWWPDAREGERIEIGRPRDDAWARLLAAGDATFLAIDYGHERADRPRGGSLMGFRDGRATRAVPDGAHDLTAHVAVDSLPQGGRRRQRDALLDLGVDATPPPLRLARTDPAAYAAGLARAGAAARLLDPGGLGGFFWVLAEPGPGGRPPSAAGRRG